MLLQKVDLHDLSPQLGDTSFDDWLARINDTVNGQTPKGLNSLVISGPVDLEKSELMCFYGISPNLAGSLVFVSEDLQLWGMDVTQGISYLLALAPE